MGLSMLPNILMNPPVAFQTVKSLPGPWENLLTPGSGRSWRERNGSPFQYSSLGNSVTEEPGRIQSPDSQWFRCYWAQHAWRHPWRLFSVRSTLVLECLFLWWRGRQTHVRPQEWIVWGKNSGSPAVGDALDLRLDTILSLQPSPLAPTLFLLVSLHSGRNSGTACWHSILGPTGETELFSKSWVRGVVRAFGLFWIIYTCHF